MTTKLTVNRFRTRRPDATAPQAPAAAPLRPVARPDGFQRMDLIAKEDLDRRAAMLGMPPLIKAYLRLGGTVGEGAFLDRPFNTTDVLLMMDTALMSAKHRDFYTARWQTNG